MAVSCVLHASRTSLDAPLGRPKVGLGHGGAIEPSTARPLSDAVASDSTTSRERARSGRAASAAQYARFCVVGLSNALVDLGVLNLLLLARPTHSPVALLLDNTVAVTLAIANSWIWNTRWTFRAQVTKQRRQRLLFVAQALLNVIANNLVLLGMTGVLPASQGVSALVASNLAKLAAMVVASSLSFLLLRTFVFMQRAQDAPPAYRLRGQTRNVIR